MLSFRSARTIRGVRMTTPVHNERVHPSGIGSDRGLRRAELLAAISLAIDLGLGQPMEHMLRSSLIATRIAERMGLDAQRRATVYYANLVGWIGCHADSHELAALFGDDIAFRADTYGVDMAGFPFLRLMASHVGRDSPGWERGVRTAAFLMTARHQVGELIHSHCSSAGVLSDRMGLDPQVGRALAYIFERWDGRGMPNGVRGQDIPDEVHIVRLADVAEVHLRTGGVSHAVEVARARRATQFSPEVADVFVRDAEAIVDGLLDIDVWTAALAQAPDRHRTLNADETDDMLRAVADFVDLKCPCSPGYSRGVADVAAEAARRLRMPTVDVSRLYRAGLVHGLGRLGVSNQIWNKKGPLTTAESERLELYPYLTGRILSRVGGLESVVSIATKGEERIDGSGFPRGLVGAELSAADRLLAASVAYHQLLEPHRDRPALDIPGAARTMREHARAARLDNDSVEAVLAAAGHQTPRRTSRDGSLTPREMEVLRLVAQGRSNREIATALHIAEKTARNHVERVYAKLNVNNRTQASLAAIDRGLAPFVADAR
ncbi:Transcriptional regulatory protein DegU [Mycolicibacterium chubuense]|uniref:Transcriptional regulatory protein DegU n=2 Tax=Mycolicibacterium chubuense TaxID=1800 RepID=A0A0J6WQB9_MYCCU|nr:Transcriptional regulatory protein DegU [Mycolicibacterium chubuense]SPY00821.1 HD-GYP domain-containing protein [Mycolicibacterium chubuense]